MIYYDIGHRMVCPESPHYLIFLEILYHYPLNTFFFSLQWYFYLYIFGHSYNITSQLWQHDIGGNVILLNVLCT